MNASRSWFLVLAASLLFGSGARADLIIGTPITGGYGLDPFGSGAQISEEFQQIYNKSDFQSLGSGPITINELSYFAKAGSQVDTANYTFTFYETTTAVNGLDRSNLANNLAGAVNRQVFAVDSLGGAVGSSNVLSISGAGYIYDPSRYNLLVDIQKTNYVPHVGDNALFEITPGPSSGSLVTNQVDSTSINATGYGLVTGFGFAVPEPASLLMTAGATLAGLGYHVWKRTGRNRSRGCEAKS